MRTKLYDNKEWLERHYKINHEKVPDIAASCKVTEKTIYNALKKHGLL